ncbi:MAG: phage portal protein [Bacillota bacterium]
MTNLKYLYHDLYHEHKKISGLNLDNLSLMEARKLINTCLDRHSPFVKQAKQARAYYLNHNDIKRQSGPEEMAKQLKLEYNPLRSADYRISHNWHNLLVNQKAAYLFSWAPTFDSGEEQLNRRLNGVLGSKMAKIAKDLVVEASNTGVGWLHSWIDAKGAFHYAVVPSEQVIPLYSDDLQHQLQAVLRVYHQSDDLKYELWTDKQVVFYSQKGQAKIQEEGRLAHSLGGMPFVPFYNNSQQEGDLCMYKDLIDQYDKVVSGYANDLTDIQEIVFVLRNYGGEDLATFLSELKRYKAIKVDGEGGAGGGLETMSIDIPIEARREFLTLLRKQIFISGQGVDPDPAGFGNASGVALKYLYSLLEIKAGLLETEFRAGFAELLRLILRYLGVDPDCSIQQIYVRNSIENDLETSKIARESLDIISKKSILQNHPWVEDAESEQKALQREKLKVAEDKKE